MAGRQRAGSHSPGRHWSPVVRHHKSFTVAAGLPHGPESDAPLAVTPSFSMALPLPATQPRAVGLYLHTPLCRACWSPMIGPALEGSPWPPDLLRPGTVFCPSQTRPQLAPVPHPRPLSRTLHIASAMFPHALYPLPCPLPGLSCLVQPLASITAGRAGAHAPVGTNFFHTL